MKALERVTAKFEFDPLIVGFKRAHRLVEKEQWERRPVDAAMFQHPSESALHKAVENERGRKEASVKTGEYSRALDALVGLKPAVDRLFQSCDGQCRGQGYPQVTGCRCSKKSMNYSCHSQTFPRLWYKDGRSNRTKRQASCRRD